MQTGELVELAVGLARHSAALTASTAELSQRGLENYWTASKCRFDRWGRALQGLRRGELPDFHGFGTVRGLIEEMLGGEILARIWTAVVVSRDRALGRQDAEILVRSVYVGQLDIRNRVLKILIHGPSMNAAEAVELNRLRRRAELWIDMLLATFGPRHDVGEFAIDAARMSKMATDFREGATRVRRMGDPAAWADVTLRTAAKHAFASPAPNFDLNAKVAAAVLETLPADLFDSLGLLRSAWMIRMATTADDAQRLVSEMFETAVGDNLPKNPRRF